MVTNVRFKKTFVGMPVPDQKYGNVGRLIEDELEKSGLALNKGKGVDIPAFDIEVKTREVSATSAQTIGSMTINDIVSTPYEQSNIYNKIQIQRRIKHSTLSNVVVSDDVYDFTDPFIQKKIKDAYETARAKIIAGDRSAYIRGDKKQWGYFEQTVGTADNIRDFRIPNKQFKQIEQLSKDSEQFAKLFETIE